MKSLGRLFGLTVSLALASQLCGQTTRPLTPQQEWDRLIRQAENDLIGLPVVRAESPDQIVRFQISSNMLSASTPLKSPGRDASILAKDFPGYIHFKWIPANPNSGLPDGFSLLAQDLSDIQIGQVNTMVSIVAGRMILSRDMENGQTLRSVQLIIDTLGITDADEDPVRLFVNQTALGSSSQDIKIVAHARSFIDLRLQDRQVVDTYLRPIIRGFRQEQVVFEVPRDIAWQVLGRDEPPAADAVKAVEPLIAQLNDDDFRRRQAAIQELKNMGQAATRAMMKLDRAKLSLQQNAEVDSLLAGSAPIGLSSSIDLAKDRNFLLDVLYSDDSALRASAVRHLQSLTGQTPALDANAPLPERSKAIAELRQQLAPTTSAVSK